MTENERVEPVDSKQGIRERYKGKDPSRLHVIPAKPKHIAGDGSVLRVAAYCRVSTENEEQTSSYELQKNYYTDYIQNQPGWELVGIYGDEGVSGTSIKHRDGLQRLLEDCRAGKIDIIITKSIARFARNIVDCISMIDELKTLKPPVSIIFETDNINTAGTTSDILLSILSALAQMESSTKSEIMEWSIVRRFQNGIFLLPELIGFDKDEDGNLVINEDEALTVRLCFYLFLAGFSLTDIAEILTELGRKTGFNKRKNKKALKANPDAEVMYKTTWTSSSVVEILRNERHCGDVLTRKTYTESYKTHKKVRNDGDREQIVEYDNHDAIVSRAIWEAANKKLDLMYGCQDTKYPTLKVVDDGALKGFVPVNRKWGGFTPEDFKLASESVYTKVEANEPAGNSVLAGYKVVRSQLFNTYLYPAVTISSGKLRFNTACLRRFEDVEYVELLINSVDKCLAIRPCQKDNPNAIHWGSLREGKWTVLEKSCRGFASPLYEMMAWDTELKYRMRGSFISDGEEKMMLFDLEEPEIIKRELVEDPVGEVAATDDHAAVSSETDGSETAETVVESQTVQKPVFRRVILHPESWKNSFGKSYEEDAQYLVRIHYSGNWDVLRPAREIFGVNPITEEEIDALLCEAQQIIERLRATA